MCTLLCVLHVCSVPGIVMSFVSICVKLPVWCFIWLCLLKCLLSCVVCLVFCLAVPCTKVPRRSPSRHHTGGARLRIVPEELFTPPRWRSRSLCLAGGFLHGSALGEPFTGPPQEPFIVTHLISPSPPPPRRGPHCATPEESSFYLKAGVQGGGGICDREA